jgi:hypothetical protein
MLRRAGAPEPWAHPDKLADVVSMLASAAELSAGMPDAGGHISRIRRAQKAVDELRRVLPDLISFHFAGADLLDPPSLSILEETRKLHAQRANSLHGMLTSLVDVEESFSSVKLEKMLSGWHMAAVGLFSSYVACVGKGTHSRRGPAARFVRAALKAAGYDEPELGAIEAALNERALRRTKRASIAS